MAEIIFWQRIVSPHMAGLARELAKRGHSVVYVSEKQMSEARTAMGWDAPEVFPARLVVESEVAKLLSLARQQSPDAIHLCQGLRANGMIGSVQKELSRLGRRQWAIMETVDDRGYTGPFKRSVYSYLCRKFMAQGDGVLAIGQDTPRWLEKRCVPRARIFPFAYFLPEHACPTTPPLQQSRPFRIAFAGQLVSRKRVQDLILAVERFGAGVPPWEILVIGDGPESDTLCNLAKTHAPGRVQWLGMRPMACIPDLLAQVDLLVLPSQFDGWGAVVSEALMVGTPAVCSDQCGVSGVVRASGVGGVFPAGDVRALSKLLERMVKQGPLTHAQRAALCGWAASLGAKKGAEYLSAILSENAKESPRPFPPWLEARR